MCKILNNYQLFFDILMKKKNRPVETYITLKRMQSVTAQAIFDCLHDVLILMGKYWHSVLLVCFNGASTMAGKIGGVQEKCKEQNSNIIMGFFFAILYINTIFPKSFSEYQRYFLYEI
jgi:hypothetical protein